MQPNATLYIVTFSQKRKKKKSRMQQRLSLLTLCVYIYIYKKKKTISCMAPEQNKAKESREIRIKCEKKMKILNFLFGLNKKYIKYQLMKTKMGFEKFQIVSLDVAFFSLIFLCTFRWKIIPQQNNYTLSLLKNQLIEKI